MFSDLRIAIIGVFHAKRFELFVKEMLVNITAKAVLVTSRIIKINLFKEVCFLKSKVILG